MFYLFDCDFYIVLVFYLIPSRRDQAVPVAPGAQGTILFRTMFYYVSDIRFVRLLKLMLFVAGLSALGLSGFFARVRDTLFLVYRGL